MSAISDIYDYFSPIEDAIRTVFEANEIVCWTPLSDPDFQKERPRVEAVLLPGQNLGRLLPVVLADGETRRRNANGFLREQARRSQLVIRVITESDIAVHRTFVAEILYLMDTAGHDMNAGDKLPNHAVSGLNCTGGTLETKAEEGSYMSVFMFDLDFSVKTAAWDALT